MDQDVIATHLENLDRRLARVEQILPTLATKDELTTLATKEELAAAIAPLATKEDLGELRRHMEVLHEEQRSDVRLLAEHVLSLMPKHPER